MDSRLLLHIIDSVYSPKIILIIGRMLLNYLNLRKASKIFVIGFNKTGTRSIHTIFKKIGLPSYHGGKWRSCDNMRLFRLYDCFSDGTPRSIARLDELFPGARFILQVRELDSWILSRLAHIERLKRKGRHKGVNTWDTTEYAIHNWIKRRNDYHINVLTYFYKRDDLLIINYIRDEHASRKICQFIGYSRYIPKPRKNIDPERKRPDIYVEMLYKCTKELNIPDNELKYDIFCPSLANMDIYGHLPYDTSLLQMQ